MRIAIKGYALLKERLGRDETVTIELKLKQVR